jgi:hypothetical protein
LAAFLKLFFMMNINGIEFSQDFINSFKNADDFVESTECKHFVGAGIVTEDALKVFFKIVTANEDKAIQQPLEEAKLQPGSAEQHSGKERGNSKPAGNTVKQRANK